MDDSENKNAAGLPRPDEAGLLDLKDLMKKTLEAKGVIGAVRAQLRAAVFTALDEQERAAKYGVACKTNMPGLPNRVHVRDTVENTLVSDLIMEYFESLDLENSLSVYSSEINLDPARARSRSDLGFELGLDVHSEEKEGNRVPLLVLFLRQAMLHSSEADLAEHNRGQTIPKMLRHEQTPVEVTEDEPTLSTEEGRDVAVGSFESRSSQNNTEMVREESRDPFLHTVISAPESSTTSIEFSDHFVERSPPFNDDSSSQIDENMTSSSNNQPSEMQSSVLESESSALSAGPSFFSAPSSAVQSSPSHNSVGANSGGSWNEDYEAGEGSVSSPGDVSQGLLESPTSLTRLSVNSQGTESQVLHAASASPSQAKKDVLQSPLSYRSQKSIKSQQSPKSTKSQQSPKSIQSQQSPKSIQSQQSPKPRKSQQSPKSTKSQQSPKSTKSQLSPNSIKSQQSPKSTKSQLSPKSIKSQQSPKSTKSQLSPRSIKSNRSTKSNQSPKSTHSTKSSTKLSMNSQYGTSSSPRETDLTTNSTGSATSLSLDTSQLQTPDARNLEAIVSPSLVANTSEMTLEDSVASPESSLASVSTYTGLKLGESNTSEHDTTVGAPLVASPTGSASGRSNSGVSGVFESLSAPTTPPPPEHPFEGGAVAIPATLVLDAMSPRSATSSSGNRIPQERYAHGTQSPNYALMAGMHGSPRRNKSSPRSTSPRNNTLITAASRNQELGDTARSPRSRSSLSPSSHRSPSRRNFARAMDFGSDSNGDKPQLASPNHDTTPNIATSLDIDVETSSMQEHQEDSGESEHATGSQSGSVLQVAASPAGETSIDEASSTILSSPGERTNEIVDHKDAGEETEQVGTESANTLEQIRPNSASSATRARLATGTWGLSRGEICDDVSDDGGIYGESSIELRGGDLSSEDNLSDQVEFESQVGENSFNSSEAQEGLTAIATSAAPEEEAKVAVDSTAIQVEEAESIDSPHYEQSNNALVHSKHSEATSPKGIDNMPVSPGGSVDRMEQENSREFEHPFETLESLERSVDGSVTQSKIENDLMDAESFENSYSEASFDVDDQALGQQEAKTATTEEVKTPARFTDVCAVAANQSEGEDYYEEDEFEDVDEIQSEVDEIESEEGLSGGESDDDEEDFWDNEV